MARTNAATRSALQAALRDATQTAQRITEEITGAKSDAVKAAAGALRKTWRDLLKVPAAQQRVSLKTRRLRGEPSAPGEPPRKLSGRVQGSVRQAVVDGVRRVGTGWFVLRLLETGATATVNRRSSAKGLRGGSRKVATRRGSYTVRLAPRPSAAPAVEQAAPQMVDVFVSAAQQRMARGGA